MTFHKTPPAQINTTLATWLPESFQLQQAQGCTLYGRNDETFLDFTSGLGSAFLGYQHARLQAALLEKINLSFPHPAGLWPSSTLQSLADNLREWLPAHLDHLHPCAGGRAALEQAVSLTRMITGRPHTITLHPANTFPAGSFHIPFPRPVDFAGDQEAAAKDTIQALQDMLAQNTGPDNVAAIVVPSALGPQEGCALMPVSVLTAVREFCDHYRLFLILDERETAGGRTGRMFAALDASRPDMVVLGGSLMAGLPLGVLLFPEALVAPGILSTAGGDVLGAAVAAEALAILEEEAILPAVAERGSQLLSGLRELQTVYPFFGDVRGEGLFVGVEIGVPGRGPDADLAQRIQEACLERGLILQVGGPDHNVIAWLPPLLVQETEISAAFDILDDALEEIFED